MFDVNPDWSLFFSKFIQLIIAMVESVGETCMKAFYVLQSYTVEEALREILPDGIVGDVLDFLAGLVISEWFFDLWLWEFLLFGGIAVAVMINIYKAIG